MEAGGLGAGWWVVVGGPVPRLTKRWPSKRRAVDAAHEAARASLLQQELRLVCALVAIDDLENKRYKIYYYYESDTWELYCLTDDQREAVNLIDSHPQIASSLSKKIRAWLAKKHPTWKPKYPIEKKSGKPAGPPPVF